MVQNSFWRSARRMLREWPLVVLSVSAAALSAFGLGAGLLGITPILKTLIDGEDAGGLKGMLRSLRQERESLAPLIPDWLLAWVTDDPYHSVLWTMAGLAVLTVVGATLTYTHTYVAETVVQRTVARLRDQMFARAMRLPMIGVVSKGSDVITRVVNDPNALSGGLRTLLSKAVAQVTKGVVSLAAAFLLDWRLALASCLLGPPVYTVIRRIGKRIRRSSRRVLESLGSIAASTTDAVHGLRVVKVYTAEAYEIGRFKMHNARWLEQHLRIRTAASLSSPLVEVLTLLALIGVSIVAVKAVLDGELDPEMFILTLGALAVAGASLKPMANIVADIQGASAAAERVEAFLALPMEPGLERRLPRLDRHTRSIRFEAVRFTYPGADRPAVDGVDLDIRAGETVAFVGPNGSGKTTLLALVPRLFDPDPTPPVQPEGRLLVDGIDVRSVRVRSLRRQIGVVTQETVLFGGSIRENIAYGSRGVSEDRVMDAARRARAWDFIEQLPGGLDAPVGERGTSLSGGQRQRIAIARAILRDPAILILDEATSMIDADSEKKIVDAITEFGRGRTVLVVAHRLSTVVSADRIVVLDKGRVVDVGSHDELLARCGLYHDLARHQLVGRAAE